MIFVFLHILKSHDDDCSIQELFVKSVYTFFPNARLIQVSDLKTPKVKNVKEVFRFDGDPSKIMEFRINANQELDLKEPAIYIDSDMVLLKKFNEENFIINKKNVLLKRTFNNDFIMKENFKNIEFKEFKNRTLGEIFPFLACFIKSNSSDFWLQMKNELNLIDSKYLYWYGDQVALKNLVKKSFENFDFVDEKLFACPPEYLDKKKFPFIVHFKGNFNKSVISNNINNIKNYLEVCEKIMKKNNSQI